MIFFKRSSPVINFCVVGTSRNDGWSIESWIFVQQRYSPQYSLKRTHVRITLREEYLFGRPYSEVALELTIVLLFDVKFTLIFRNIGKPTPLETDVISSTRFAPFSRSNHITQKDSVVQTFNIFYLRSHFQEFLPTDSKFSTTLQVIINRKLYSEW